LPKAVRNWIEQLCGVVDEDIQSPVLLLNSREESRDRRIICMIDCNTDAFSSGLADEFRGLVNRAIERRVSAPNAATRDVHSHSSVVERNCYALSRASACTGYYCYCSHVVPSPRSEDHGAQGDQDHAAAMVDYFQRWRRQTGKQARRLCEVLKHCSS
jgi:hypothetical protein